MLFVSGCIARRGMLTDKIYYSNSSPNLQIEVNPSFKYEKGGRNEFDHKFTDLKNGRWFFLDYYIGSANDTQVDYYNHPSQWIYEGIPEDSIINKGDTELLGKKWYFANTLSRKSNGIAFSKYLRRFTDRHNVFTIKYVKWYPKKECGMWNYSLALDVEKSMFLAKFDESLKKAVTITPYIEK